MQLKSTGIETNSRGGFLYDELTTSRDNDVVSSSYRNPPREFISIPVLFNCFVESKYWLPHKKRKERKSIGKILRTKTTSFVICKVAFCLSTPYGVLYQMSPEVTVVAVVAHTAVYQFRLPQQLSFSFFRFLEMSHGKRVINLVCKFHNFAADGINRLDYWNSLLQRP